MASDLGNLKLEALFISMTGQVTISSGGTNVRVCENVILVVEGFPKSTVLTLQRQGKFIYDKLSFDGEELIAEPASQ